MGAMGCRFVRPLFGGELSPTMRKRRNLDGWSTPAGRTTARRWYVTAHEGVAEVTTVDRHFRCLVREAPLANGPVGHGQLDTDESVRFPR